MNKKNTEKTIEMIKEIQKISANVAVFSNDSKEMIKFVLDEFEMIKKNISLIINGNH